MPDPSTVTHVTLSVPLVNSVLDYLTQRPFREVQELIFHMKREADESFAAQQCRTEDSASKP